MEPPLRSRLIRLAHAQPELRPHLLPLLKEAAPNHTDSEIVDIILMKLSKGYGAGYEGEDEHFEQLEEAVRRMRLDGVDFNSKKVLAVFDKDDYERDEYFEDYDGYATMNRVLSEIFNG